MRRKIIIGTRGSELALWQANHISDLLKNSFDLDVSLKIIKTKGDEIQHLGFDKMEGKGFFTKEIEQALLSKEIDVAVHSHKDLETKSPKGLTIAAVTEREDPAELLLIHPKAIDNSQSFSLKQNAVVGTSAPRRKSQMLTFRQDIQVKDLRGNVPTRYGKLLRGDYDAILIAKAGISRLQLDLSESKVIELDTRMFIPAPAQGVLGIQIREGDQELFDKVSRLTHADTLVTTKIERNILQKMEGGCQIPLGAYCYQDHQSNFHLWASYAKSAQSVSKRMYLTHTNPDELITNAVNILKSGPENKSVFVSRNLDENSIFKRILTENGYQITGKSLIEFEELLVNEIPETDWVFFSSKNAVKFYLKRFKLSGKTKIGVVGATTKGELIRKGYNVHFVGAGVDTVKIGKEFKARVGQEKVLFPMVENGSLNVVKQFNKESTFIVQIYRTISSENITLPDADILIFTSPSNVESYLKGRILPKNRSVIAMGRTTAAKLEENGFHSFVLPWNPSEIALADAIISLG